MGIFPRGLHSENKRPQTKVCVELAMGKPEPEVGIRSSSWREKKKKKMLHHLNYEYSDGPAGKPLKNLQKCPREKNKASPSSSIQLGVFFIRINLQRVIGVNIK